MTRLPSLVLKFRFNIEIKLYSQVKQGLHRESLEDANEKHTKFRNLPHVQSSRGLPIAASFFMCSQRVQLYELGEQQHQALPIYEGGAET